jgi:putative nucleotidyltransferase with HDIG domain
MDFARIRRAIQEDPLLARVSRLAKGKDIPLYLVGGYLRDLLLGVHGKDYDLTVPRGGDSPIAFLEEELSLRLFKAGKEEAGTVTYRAIKGDLSIDCAFFQGETIDEDLGRRDFTVNAMAFSLRDETFHSAQGALEDIEGRVIRSVSSRSIDEDPLRLLRAIRYGCVLGGFRIGDELRDEIAAKSGRIVDVPGERIKMELDQTLLSPRPEQGVRLLYELGLLFALFPELKGLENLAQGEYHHLSALGHTLLAVEKTGWAIDWAASRGRDILLNREDRLSLSYAALFHDIGKQDTLTKDEDSKTHFYHHESFSAQAAERIMERLKSSNAAKQNVVSLVQNHMRIITLPAETKETALRRLAYRMKEQTPLLVLLALADKEASRGILSVELDPVVRNHCLRLLDLFQQKEILHPPSLVTGRDVMALGYNPGPRVGQILGSIREKQVTGEIRTREEALAALREQFTLE